MLPRRLAVTTGIGSSPGMILHRLARLRALNTRFLRFCLVGVIGFALDAGTLQLLISGAGLDPFVARLGSYLVAATGTWWLNRRITFIKGSCGACVNQWLHYLSVNGVGAGINYGIYVLSLLTLDMVRQTPVLGVALGSALALIFNYVANLHWVFGDDKR